MIHRFFVLTFILLFKLNLGIALSQKEELNTIFLRGEDFKEEAYAVLVCSDNCLVIDKAVGYVAFTLKGKIGERNILITGETPLLKGTKKIRVDKDGDPNSHQKLTIEIFGENPTVDKETYEIQGESDEAIITIHKLDDAKREIAGTFSVKYIDDTSGLKRLGASCRFLIKQN